MNNIIFTSAKIVLTILILIIIVLFLTPMLTANIINAGNVFGAVLFLSLLFALHNTKNISIIIFKNRDNMIFKIFFILFVVIFVAMILIFAIMSYHMYKSSNNYPDKNTTVVILGCKVNGKNPSLTLMNRINTAYKYLSENKNAVAIASGGRGEDEEIEEALCIKNHLVDMGIDEKRIYLEDKSTSTYENILFSKKIIEDNNLINDISIVTNEYHQLRAEKLAKKLGIKSYAIKVKTEYWLFPTYYFRELLANIYQSIFYK